MILALAFLGQSVLHGGLRWIVLRSRGVGGGDRWIMFVGPSPVGCLSLKYMDDFWLTDGYFLARNYP